MEEERIERIRNKKCLFNFLDFIRTKVLRILSDKAYIKLMFRIRVGKHLNLKNPKSFNEKLQWLKLYNRKDIYREMADKYKVREIIKQKIGEEYLIPLLGVYNSFDEIDFDKLPKQFVIKCNHDSGSVVVCNDKDNFDKEKAQEKIEKALKKDYYLIGREWQYKNIERKIVVEKYLNEISNEDLRDYKFFIFNGKLAYILVCSNRFTKVKFTFFDKNGKFMDCRQGGAEYDKSIKLPSNYKKMVELAEKLAEDTIQVRVDFYDINGKIYFGELTFFDSSGYAKFSPEEWDYKIGDMLKLPNDK